jgi:hypothetical protein
LLRNNKIVNIFLLIVKMLKVVVAVVNVQYNWSSKIIRVEVKTKNPISICN